MEHNPKYFRIILFLIIALLVFSKPAYTVDTNLRFKHITTKDGLSQSTVRSVFQDRRGFMWFGTQDGLNQYNGSQFIIYENVFNDTTCLSHNRIIDIFEDSAENLWIGTYHGLNLFDRKHNRFIRFMYDENDPHSLSFDNVTKIFEDSKGRLWIGTKIGLNLYDREQRNFTHYFVDDNPVTRRKNGIMIIYEDHKGNLWIGTYHGELYIFDENRNEFTPYIYYKGDIRQLGIEKVTGFVEDHQGSFWLATRGAGLISFQTIDRGDTSFVQYMYDNGNTNSLSSNSIRAIHLDKTGKLWIAVAGKGLDIFEISTKKFIHYQSDADNRNSISSNSIWSIYEDHDGRIYLGMYDKGVDVVDPYRKKIEHYQHVKNEKNSLSHNGVTHLLEDKQGNLWIATAFGGINCFNRKENSFTHYKHDENRKNTLSSNGVTSLYMDGEQNLWAGTWAGGISVLTKDRKSYIYYNTDNGILNTNYISTIAGDHEGNILIGAFTGGMHIYDIKKKRFAYYGHDELDPGSIGNKIVNCIYKDKKNDIWIGTSITGLNLLQKDDSGRITFMHYQHDPEDSNSISTNLIAAIHEDRQGNLWVGTQNDGLNLMDRTKGTFRVFRKEDGLPSNSVVSILEDDYGNLWLGTHGGLCKFNPQTETFRNYDVSDGLQNKEFTQGSACKTRDGYMYFGGPNGFNVFHPDSIHDNPLIPPVYLTDFRIFNRSVSIGGDSPLQKHIGETREITLNYYHSVFSFDFVALNYTHAEKNQYAYMMEGFEENWNYVGTQRTANYTNLDPGKYVFRVKSSNNDSIWNEEGVSVKIKIVPPFWKTWWAYILYFLLVVGIVFGIVWYILARERLKHELKIEHMELEKLHELDQLKSKFYSNISHEFRTPLILILGPLNRLLASGKLSHKKVKEHLQLMIRNAQCLLRMTNQLMDFHKIEGKDLKLELTKSDIIQFMKNIFLSFQAYAEQKKIDFQFISQVDSLIAWFDPDKLEKILHNLLSNAFKFTPEGGRISLKIALIKEKASNKDPDKIEFAVQDTGIGIPSDQLEHIFDRFYQVYNSYTRSHEGTGIGLALTHELIELYHGYIHSESVEGKGSCFKVCLPLDKVYLNGYGSVDKLEQIESGIPSDVMIDNSVESNNEVFLNEQVPGKDKILILLVEDNSDIRNYIRDIFSNHYYFSEAKDGVEGFEKAVEIIPDLIISDIMMPKLDGVQLCNKLKNDEKTSHIPVILLTALAEDEHRITGLKTGADAYLSKPFNEEVLRTCVKNLLDSRKKLREWFRREILLEPSDLALLSHEEKFLQKAVEFVENNIDNTELNAKILGYEIGLSREQLYRKLKGLTGQTVHEFIREIRLKRAVQLLKTGKMTVAEVAYEIGFKDTSYFSHCFQKKFNQPPSYLKKL